MFRARDSARCDRTRLVLRTAAAQCIQHNFDAARDSKFVEDSEEVVLYGVLPERESMCDLAVGEPFGDAAHHVELACRQESLSREAGEAQGNRFCDGFEQVVEFTAAGPDLTAMNAKDAFCQGLQRLGAEENPTRSGAEGLDHG